MKLNNLSIQKKATLQDSLNLIELNQLGAIFVVDQTGSVIGLATDGDIRRHLIQGGSLTDSISLCANPDYIWERPEASRELLIKKLDSKIKIIPLLDEAKHLVDVVTRDHLPIQNERAVYSRARAPVRVSFGGGGSDLTRYFFKNDGAVLNSTISLYSHATLHVRGDEKIIVRSQDLNESLEANDLESALALPGRFGLIQALLRMINPKFGFELFLHSDFPMNSGLGGSAAVTAVVLGCFNQFRRDQWDRHELAELAFQAERHCFGVAGGWQDQYATVFGGFNFIEFQMDQNIVHPLRMPVKTLLELEESLVLCDTGIAHSSGEIHEDQQERMMDHNIKLLVDGGVRLSYEMRNHLLRGRLLEFGQCLDKIWQLKRKLSDKISSADLDQIYSGAKSNGAAGGKILGAGGGGFFLFFAAPHKKYKLIEHLERSGLKTSPFRFEPEGLQAWTFRESVNYSVSKMP